MISQAKAADAIEEKWERHVQLATHAEFQPGSPIPTLQFWDSKLKLDRMRDLDWNRGPIELLVRACL
ncbi:MAG: hypothetical protein AB4352_21430 [Hormoscilla sp.]